MDRDQLCRTLVEGRLILIQDESWNHTPHPSTVMAFDLRTGNASLEVQLEYGEFLAALGEGGAPIVRRLPYGIPGGYRSKTDDAGWAVTEDAAVRASVAEDAWLEYGRLLARLPEVLQGWAKTRAARVEYAKSLSTGVQTLFDFATRLRAQYQEEFSEVGEPSFSCAFPNKPFPGRIPSCGPDGDPWPAFIAQAKEAHTRLVTDLAAGALRLKELQDARLREAGAAIAPSRSPSMR